MDKDVLEQMIAEKLSIRQMSARTLNSYSTIRHWLSKYQLSTHYGKRQHECRCGETDPVKFYQKRKNKCIACSLIADVQFGVKKKQKAVDFLGGKCVVCGYDKYNGALHFHHTDPTQKEDWGSSRNWGFDRLKKELIKCILVCGNCHAEIHGGLIDDKQYMAK